MHVTACVAEATPLWWQAEALRPFLEEVTRRVRAGFSAADARYFELEFHLFETITRISGVLKVRARAPALAAACTIAARSPVQPIVVPNDRARTKELRKRRIRQELEGLIVPRSARLYLPTNPESEVRACLRVRACVTMRAVYGRGRCCVRTLRRAGPFHHHHFGKSHAERGQSACVRLDVLVRVWMCAWVRRKA